MEKLWKVSKIDHTQTAQTVQTIVFFVNKYILFVYVLRVIYAYLCYS